MKCSGFFSFLVACGALAHGGSAISFIGDLRINGNVLACGTGCTLGPGNSDGDFAQWAAFLTPFTVSTTTTMQAITFSYGGGVNGHGATILQGGFEPYLSLFDGSGTFLASTFFGTTCPAGAHRALGGRRHNFLSARLDERVGAYCGEHLGYSGDASTKDVGLAENNRMNSTRRLRLKLYEINAPDQVSQIDFRAAAHFAMTVTPAGTDGSTHSAIADKGNTCHIHQFDS